MPIATLKDVEAQGLPPDQIPRNGDPLDQIWAELRGYHALIVEFKDMEPDQVLLAISGYAARTSEIRAHLSRSNNRAAASFKTNIVEPLLADLDFQFRLHSRIQAVRDWDLRLSGGQT